MTTYTIDLGFMDCVQLVKDVTIFPKLTETHHTQGGPVELTTGEVIRIAEQGLGGLRIKAKKVKGVDVRQVVRNKEVLFTI